MTRTAFLLIVMMLASSVHITCAQPSIRQFLQSAESDVTLRSLDDQIAYLSKKPYRLSLLNKFELRAQNNEFGNKTSQRYGLRVSPANPWEIRNTNNYFTTYSESLAIEKEIAYKEALLERYYLIVDYLHEEALKELLEKNKKLIDAQYTVIERQQASGYFDADDFAEVKLEQIEKIIEEEELFADMRNHLAKISRQYNDLYIKTVEWKDEAVISIEKIEKIMDSLVMSSSSSSSLAYQNTRINLARREYALERSNFNLGFVQTQYTEGRTEQDRTPWGLSIGLNIPLTNPNKGDMAKRQLDVIEEGYKKTAIELNEEKKKTATRERLKDLISNYHAAQLRMEALNIDAIGRTLSTMKGNNPLVMLKLNSSFVKLEIVRARLKRDVLISYIDFLDVHDKLQQKPVVNYLSPSLESIKD